MSHAGRCCSADRKGQAKADRADDYPDQKHDQPLNLDGEQALKAAHERGERGLAEASENCHTENQWQSAKLDRQN